MSFIWCLVFLVFGIRSASHVPRKQLNWSYKYCELVILCSRVLTFKPISNQLSNKNVLEDSSTWVINSWICVSSFNFNVIVIVSESLCLYKSQKYIVGSFWFSVSLSIVLLGKIKLIYWWWDSYIIGIFTLLASLYKLLVLAWNIYFLVKSASHIIINALKVGNYWY